MDGGHEMTKQEYLNTVLIKEDRGWLDRSDICEIASKAWDAAVEQSCEWLKANANKYIVDIGIGYEKTELIIGGACWADLKEAMENTK